MVASFHCNAESANKRRLTPQGEGFYLVRTQIHHDWPTLVLFMLNRRHFPELPHVLDTVRKLVPEIGTAPFSVHELVVSFQLQVQRHPINHLETSVRLNFVALDLKIRRKLAEYQVGVSDDDLKLIVSALYIPLFHVDSVVSDSIQNDQFFIYHLFKMILIGVVLFIIGLLFIGQGIYYMILKKRNQLPQKMTAIAVLNMLFGIMAIIFGIIHFFAAYY